METRVQTREVVQASGYAYPLATTLITATAEGTAHDLGSVRDNSLGYLERLFVANQTGTTATLTFYAIPEGGTIGASNKEMTALSIAPNQNANLAEFTAGLYAPGTTFKAFSGTASALIVGGYIRGAF